MTGSSEGLVLRPAKSRRIGMCLLALLPCLVAAQEPSNLAPEPLPEASAVVQPASSSDVAADAAPSETAADASAADTDSSGSQGAEATAAAPPSTDAHQPALPPFQGGIFALYADNRSLDVPNFITADLLLTAHAMLEQATIRQIEVDVLAPALARLVARLEAGLAERAEAEPEDPVVGANRDFLAVLAALLRPEQGRPEGLGERAEAELALALAAEGPAPSPLWERRLDYSQLKPRGDYADDPARAAYFRASRYAGLVLFPFRVSPATAVDEALADRCFEQAMQLLGLIKADPDAAAAYATIDEASTWWFGGADDLSVQRLQTLAAKAPKDQVVDREWMLAAIDDAGDRPTVLGDIIDLDALADGEHWSDVLVGWRLLPTRRRADARAFQALIYDRVGAYRGAEGAEAAPVTLGIIGGLPVKAFPSALELMALLGSSPAEQMLQATGATDFDGYAQARAQAAAALSEAVGREAAKLRMLEDWLEADTADPIEARRRMASALGYWTRDRWQSVLYAKQSYTPMGKGLNVDAPRDGAWIEPAVALYQGLLELARAQWQRTSEPMWEAMVETMEPVVKVARKAADGGPLSADDQAFLNDLDLNLKELIGARDRPLVVDVHTSPATGDLLEQGLGLAQPVYHRPEGRPAARGALSTHYELRVPIEQRLDDQAWREMLDQGEVPVTATVLIEDEGSDQ
jgi:hypothetical protein